MADITITHSRADGTLVRGSVKGDGVWDVLKNQPYSWLSSRRGLTIQQSRGRAAKTWVIESAVTALRAAGHTVTVDLDDTTPGADPAAVEAERAERAAARVERRHGYAASAAASGDTSYQAYRQIADAWPAGQPIVSDQARRAHARMTGSHERASAEYDRSRHHAAAAAAAEANQSHHESIPAALRRIAGLEARERRLRRDIIGRPGWDAGKLTLIRPDAGRLAVLEADLAQVRADLDYWRTYVEESGEKVWGPGDFTAGDFVTAGGGTWYQVERVNAKSLSVPSGTNTHQLGGVVTRDRVRHARGPSQWTRKITYDSVRGRRPAGDRAALLAEAAGPPAVRA